MYIIRVIESKVWKNIVDGRTASIYGSTPWASNADKPNWTISARGWTWAMSNGTVGFGRMAVSTESEAKEIMQQFNQRIGR